MPKLTVDMFDSEPHVGDKVKVTGVIKSISDSGEVEASYDKVEIVNDESKLKYGSQDQSDSTPDNLDEALSKAFPNTQ